MDEISKLGDGFSMGGPSTAGGAQAQLLAAAAKELGTTPQDLATVISYESGFNPGRWGGKGGKYLGLIQFGPEEQARYGVKEGQSFAEQLPKVVQFLKDRGFKPGMGLADLYSTINAGSPGRYSASDGNGTVAEHVAKMQQEHGEKVRDFLGGSYGALQSDAQSAGQPSASAHPVDDFGEKLKALSQFSMTAPTQVPAPTPAPTVAASPNEVVVSAPQKLANWGPVENFINKVVPFGYGLKAMAGVDTLAQKAGVPNWLMGRDASAPPMSYQENLTALDAARKTDELQSPHGGAAGVVGSVAGLYGATKALGALGGAAVEAMPASWAARLGPVGSFLNGTAGLEKAAIGPQASSAGQALTRGGALAANGALQGVAADAWEAGGYPEDWKRSAMLGAGGNLLLGPAGDYFAAGLRKNPVQPEVARNARNLLAQDVPVYPWQLSADAKLSAAGKPSVLSLGAGYNDHMAAGQLEALRDAALRRTGAEDISRLAGGVGYTPEVARANSRRIGAAMDDIASVTPQIPLDATRYQALAQQAMDNATTPEARAQIQRATDLVLNAAAHRSLGAPTLHISGEDWQTLTKSDSFISNLLGNSETNSFARRLREFLHDDLEAAGPFEQREAIRELRRQYAENEVFKKVVAGENSGMVDPTKLAQAMRTGERQGRGYDEGLLALGAASGMKFPRPEGAGGVKQGGKGHGIGGATGLGLGVAGGAVGTHLPEFLGNHAHSLMELFHGNPFLSATAVAGALGGGVKLLGERYRKNLLNSPEVTNYLLSQRSPTQTFNPFNIPAQQAYPNIPSLGGQENDEEAPWRH